MNTTVPSSPESPPPWLPQPNHGAPERLNRRTVLIADDQVDSVEALAILLEWSGHEVHVALDGKNAIVVARQYRPDLIFLDISMPELNGYEVCRRLRGIPEFADARIYAVTAFTGEPHATRLSEAGFTGQLTKPIDPLALQKLAH